MARLDFNLHGYLFQEGVKGLALGFSTATAALAAGSRRLERELAAYEARVAAGGERIGEWEDGICLFEKDDILRLESEAAAEALMDLRKAYVLAAYHLWERSAQRWTQRTNANHTVLVGQTKERGYPLDPGLDGVRDLANTLKHNSASKARRLAASWPEMLKTDPLSVTDWDWYAEIKLADADVLRVLDVVGRSGPTPRHDLSFGLPDLGVPRARYGLKRAPAGRG